MPDERSWGSGNALGRVGCRTRSRSAEVVAPVGKREDVGSNPAGFAPIERETSVNLAREDLHFWRRLRRYDVPATMIEECMAARLVGDWASACVLAGFKPDIDLAEVRARFGAAAAGRVAVGLGLRRR